MPTTHTRFGATERVIMAEISRNLKAPKPPLGAFVNCLLEVNPKNSAYPFLSKSQRWGRIWVGLFLITTNWALAHPMPNSVVVLNVHENNISGQIQLPLAELQSAIGMRVNDHSEGLISRLGDSLRVYLRAHIRPKTLEGKPWTLLLGEMKLLKTKNKISGDYKELVVDFVMTPPQSYDLRNFYFDYDVILHQVLSHKILISVKQDWRRGIVANDSTTQTVGVIELEVVSGRIPVYQVSFEQGSLWTGFKSMLKLGVRHISEGADHLLFLLTLLLPATLLAENKRWGRFGGTKYSLIRLLKIVTAFTIGHCFTLILGATKLVQLPRQPIEVLIAVSVLVSALHALRPIFEGRESWVAAGFGLVHGLAFADTLIGLNLDSKEMALSILGFNVGVELMQLFIIALVFPFLILLSRTRIYPAFRTIGAVVASVAAGFWIVERL